MVARRLNVAEQALQTEAAIKGSPSSVLPTLLRITLNCLFCGGCKHRTASEKPERVRTSA